MIKPVITALVIVSTWLTNVSHANTVPLKFEELPKVAAIFQQEKVQGTFVIYTPEPARLQGYNAQRAYTRFTPASTFKIPNSLIGLASKAVSSVDEVFYHYDGKPVFLPSWAKDMGLREAIKISNLPAYQVLARRIGKGVMQANLRQLNYGNARLGKAIDEFWLDGSLKISAIEQAQFLARLAQGKLPYPAAQQAAVRDIVRLEQGKSWVLYGKTGWSTRQQPIGWFVGWVEKPDGRIYSFALNMDTPKGMDLAKRVDIAKACLQAVGVIDLKER